MKPTIWEHFKGVWFYVFPHHLVSQIVYGVTRIRSPMAQWFMRKYISFFDVDMNDAAADDVDDYACFDDFFTRALKPGARPVCPDANAIVSPCDGVVAEFGRITDGSLLQAKDQSYTTADLLQDSALAARFRNGNSCTIYISPADYHRVHMPAAGALQTMLHVPGRLFSVARYAHSVIPRLFARNERVISSFETEHGAMAIVMVGAVNVGCIETRWHGIVAPRRASLARASYTGEPGSVKLDRGDEMGRFHMGSTVVVLFGSGQLRWSEDKMKRDGRIRMGEAMAFVDG